MINRSTFTVNCARMIDVISAANGKLFYPIEENESAAVESSVPGKDLQTAFQNTTVRVETDQPDEMPLYHPASIDEGVSTIIEVLSEAAREMLCSMTREELVSSTHMGLGAAVRNCMIFRNKNQLELYADYQKAYTPEAGEAVEPDAVSGFIVAKTWERLKQKN